jgi:mevalonate kinase
MPAISRSAPGKLILCGEHAVVYGQPAIALPVMQICTKTKIFAKPLSAPGAVRIVATQIGIDQDFASLAETSPIVRSLRLVLEYFHLDHMPACEIHISSNIPIGSGMGSSASSSVSMIRAVSEFLGHRLSDDDTNQLAYEMEKIHHGNPSGIDNTVITYAKPVFFVREKPIEFLDIPQSFELIIADTGIHASTAQAVAQVREQYTRSPKQFGALFEKIGNLSVEIRQHLVAGAIPEIGPLLTENHHFLRQMGVSCPQLDALVSAALKSGALGAKLSGGGLGGNMLALVDHSSVQTVEENLVKAGAVSIIRSSVHPSSEAAE